MTRTITLTHHYDQQPAPVVTRWLVGDCCDSTATLHNPVTIILAARNTFENVRGLDAVLITISLCAHATHHGSMPHTQQQCLSSHCLQLLASSTCNAHIVSNHCSDSAIRRVANGTSRMVAKSDSI